MSPETPVNPWITSHPWLAPVARLHASLDRALDALGPGPVATARRSPGAVTGAPWAPLLGREPLPLDPVAAGELLLALAEALQGGTLGPDLAADLQALRAGLRDDPGLRPRVVAWLWEGGDLDLPSRPGAVRLLGWSLLRRILAPVIAPSAPRDDEDRPPSPTCPTCGAPPLQAQLVYQEGIGRRSLSCGQCGTRWPYLRVGCPFCGNDDPGTLEALELEGEPRLRLDTCAGCQGYLKTYVGEGEEAVLLSDWATLHLDVLARDRGLRRLGASLFDL